MTKNRLLKVRVTERQLARIQSLADELGTDRSSVVREALDLVSASGRSRLKIRED